MSIAHKAYKKAIRIPSTVISAKPLAAQEKQMKKVYLHIGTHKTGSTSIQRWLAENIPLLRERGYDLYRGQHKRNNHIELYLAAMQYERDSLGKHSMTGISFDHDYTNMVAKQVQIFLSGSDSQKAIFTTEGLSLLRHKDEIKRLRTILGSSCKSVTIIVALRNPIDFLDSHRKQLAKKKKRKPSTDYWSALYVENDTWLTDYESLVDLYKNEFGQDNIRIIDYDDQVKLRGSVLIAFLEALDFEVDATIEAQTKRYYDNPTRSGQNYQRLRSLRRSLFGWIKPCS